MSDQMGVGDLVEILAWEGRGPPAAQEDLDLLDADSWAAITGTIVYDVIDSIEPNRIILRSGRRASPTRLRVVIKRYTLFLEDHG